MKTVAWACEECRHWTRTTRDEAEMEDYYGEETESQIDERLNWGICALATGAMYPRVLPNDKTTLAYAIESRLKTHQRFSCVQWESMSV